MKDDYEDYSWPNYSIYDRPGGVDWARSHIVVDPNGKVIGFIGGFNDDFKDDQVYDYASGQKGLGWYEKGTNVVYKHKTKKGNYVGSFGTVAGSNFWQIVLDQINSDFYLNEDDVRKMFGVQAVADHLFDQIKNYGTKHLGGDFSQFTTQVVNIAKNFVHGTGDDIIEILKAGIAQYNNNHPKKQIVWDGNKITIGEVFLAIVGYLYAAVEIIEISLILNLINYAKKKKNDFVAGYKDFSKKQDEIDKLTADLNNQKTVNTLILNNEEKNLGLI